MEIFLSTKRKGVFMKQYSFSFTPDLLNDFKKALPVYKSKKILKNYLLNEYELPESLEQLQTPVNNIVIQPYWMTEEEIIKLDRLINEAKIKNFSINRSAIMRDIMKILVEKYKDNPIQKTQQQRQTFKIPKGTKQRLSKIVEDRELTYELSSYIMDVYVPSNKFPSMRNQEHEDLNIYTDIEVFEKMDQISNEYGFKKGGRAKIFRDALSQFEAALENNPPKKSALKTELKFILEEYKSVEDIPTIKEEINKYLDE
ncbi:hypothetical protein [Bacillus massiliglaciei]|uniref:hypothetical protein n=1 Tax=Bacillus massiliglaciei TaxID=1816693 RepID=UPI000DA5F49C|nr:hypothetical protein [Bacillus massiliglaciei]